MEAKVATFSAREEKGVTNLVQVKSGNVNKNASNVNPKIKFKFHNDLALTDWGRVR